MRLVGSGHFSCSPRALCGAQGSGKSGPLVACWFRSGVASWEGEASTAASVRDGQGPGKSSQTEPDQANLESRSQGTTTSQLPQMLNGLICLWKSRWSSADGCKDAWANWKSYSGCLLEVVMTLLCRAYTKSPFCKRKSRTKIGGFWTQWFSSSLQCTSETSAKNFVTASILLCRAKAIYGCSSIQK